MARVSEIPSTDIIKYAHEYVETLGEGITWDDAVTWDSADWTWGGGETILNQDKPGLK